MRSSNKECKGLMGVSSVAINEDLYIQSIKYINYYRDKPQYGQHTVFINPSLIPNCNKGERSRVVREILHSYLETLRRRKIETPTAVSMSEFVRQALIWFRVGASPYKVELVLDPVDIYMKENGYHKIERLEY